MILHIYHGFSKPNIDAVPQLCDRAIGDGFDGGLRSWIEPLVNQCACDRNLDVCQDPWLVVDCFIVIVAGRVFDAGDCYRLLSAG